MFTARLPLQFMVRASVEGCQLDFSEAPVHLLLRYEIFTVTEGDDVIESRPDIVPQLRMPSAPSPWHIPANENPWSLAAVDVDAAILDLKFDGAKMNALIASSGGQHPLYLAFLDQATIELQFVMQAFQQGQSPCESDEYRVGALFLRLCVIHSEP